MIFVSGSERVVGWGLPPLLLLLWVVHTSTSRTSPNEQAGLVETMRMFKSCSKEEASSTAREEEMGVSPTTPFPPTKITGVSASPLVALALTMEAISSMRGCRELSLVAYVLLERMTDDARDAMKPP